MSQEIIIDNQNYKDLLRNSGSKIIISTGYGVLAEPKVSIRLAAYMLPAIELYKQLTELGNSVSLRVYFAKNAANVTLKHYDPALLESWVEKAQSYLARFMTLFHPDCPVNFYQDVPWEGKIAKTIHQLGKRKWPKEILEPIKRFPNQQQSLNYLAGHAIYMLEPLALDWISMLGGETEPEPGTVVAVVGGPQESISQQVIGVLRKQIGIHEKWKTLHVSTPIGRKPVYSRTPKQDIYFSSSQKSINISSIWDDRFRFEPEVLRDIAALANYMFGETLYGRVEQELLEMGLEMFQEYFLN